MSIVVEGDVAALPLGEEGVGHAGEVGGFEATRPAPLARDVEEVESDVEAGGALDRAAAAVEDGKPRVELVGDSEVGDGDAGDADEVCADGVVDLDGEEEVGGGVGAVDVEGLVPLRVGGVVVEESGAADAAFVEVDGGVEAGGGGAQAGCFLDAFYNLRRSSHCMEIYKIMRPCILKCSPFII